MKVDIILAGVGGQGILSIASIIGVAAIEGKLYLKQAETHGMSQRGGAVVSHLRIANYKIASDLIPIGKADIIISVEPMESLRYVDYLSPQGVVVTSTTPYENIAGYPAYSKIVEELGKLPKYIAIDAEGIAKKIGNPRASNMVMLGAAAPFLKIDKLLLEESIETVFKSKGAKVVSLNKKAFNSGLEYAKGNCT